MTEYKINLSGMTCESCEKLIRGVAERNGAAVTDVSAAKGYVVLNCDEAKLSILKQQFADKGYPEKIPESNSATNGANGRGDLSRVGKYLRSIIAAAPEVAVESKLLNYSIGTMALLVLLSALAFRFFLSSVENISSYPPLLFLIIASSVLITASYSHVRHYRNVLSCMHGMMAGMTAGMISGFLIGALIGATNGMFMGSVAGMVAGVALGFQVGRCCGIMGTLEGTMAGVMAGIMGAMTSIMLLIDNLVLFLYILFGICTIILGGLSYMLYRESVAPDAEFKLTFSQFAAMGIFLSVILALVMLYGPKGAITYI